MCVQPHLQLKGYSSLLRLWPLLTVFRTLVYGLVTLDLPAYFHGEGFFFVSVLNRDLEQYKLKKSFIVIL